MRTTVVLLAVLVVPVASVACTGSGPSARPARSSSGAPGGRAVVQGAVQRLSIDVSKGYYDPTIVHARAGVPLELTFGQGQGCLARVLFPDFGIDADLTSGGATVKIPAMKAREYSFSCGMRMVFGKIIAQ